MNSKEVTRLIAYVGGVRPFSHYVGMDYDQKGVPQQIHNWKRRGMPPAIMLANYDRLKRLQRLADRQRRGRRSA